MMDLRQTVHDTEAKKLYHFRPPADEGPNRTARNTLTDIRFRSRI
jgi:hypothetical protein